MNSKPEPNIEPVDASALRRAWHDGIASGPSVPGEQEFARIKAKQVARRREDLP
jgi:hypothetical protein